mmetsp:Transcript_19746/g.55110  ORF Transcript_19746/g.55110 Transcript_19746/m.55110 type:complete len:303 (+) Transcript_19746:1944-2852(+)
MLGTVHRIKSLEFLEAIRDSWMRGLQPPRTLVIVVIAEPSRNTKNGKEFRLDLVVLATAVVAVAVAAVFGVPGATVVGPARGLSAEFEFRDSLRSSLHLVGRKSTPSDPKNRRHHGRTRQRGNGGRSCRGTRKGGHTSGNPRCGQSPRDRKECSGKNSGPADLDSANKLLPRNAILVAVGFANRVVVVVVLVAVVVIVDGFGFPISGRRRQQNQSPGNVLFQGFEYACRLQESPSFEFYGRLVVALVSMFCLRLDVFFLSPWIVIVIVITILFGSTLRHCSFATATAATAAVLHSIHVGLVR